MYVFHMSRNTFNYILENIREGHQKKKKKVATKILTSPEMWLAISLYKKRGLPLHYWRNGWHSTI